MLIGIAFLVAAPVACRYLMNSWLKNFVFRIDIGVGVFALSILTSIIIAWLTVGYKSIRAATAEPRQESENRVIMIAGRFVGCIKSCMERFRTSE